MADIPYLDTQITELFQPKIYTYSVGGKYYSCSLLCGYWLLMDVFGGKNVEAFL